MSGDDHYREMMVEAIQDRREWNGEQTQYTAPERDQKWRARDLLDIHWNLTGIKCPESFNRIMSCIVGHVNVNTGACFPKQTTIGIETGCSRSTVRRAVEWWTTHKFLKTEDRGRAHALAYHPQFKLFDMYYLAATEDIAAQKEEAKMEHACAIKGEHACVTKGEHGVHQYGGTHNLKEKTSKENLKEESKPEWARSSERAFVEGKKEKEEGIQRGEVESASTSSQRPEGPSYNEANERVVGYCEPFHWDHLTQEEFDAAIAAEMVEVGAGRAVIDAAANETWLAQRKGKEQ